MRLSGLSLAAVLAFSSFLLAQHHPGGGGSSTSSGGGSSSSSSPSSSGYSGGFGNSGGNSGASSHNSGSGSSPSGGSSHSSGGGGYSPSAGSSHSDTPSHGSGHNSSAGDNPSGTGNHNSGAGSSSSNHGAGGGRSESRNNGAETSGDHAVSGAHVSGGASISNGHRGKSDRASHLENSRRADLGNSSSKLARSIHEPKAIAPGRVVEPQKRGFFSFLRHPFRKSQPKVEARPALYLPRPVCPRGHCAPACPVGQVSRGGACTTPPISACGTGQIFPARTGIACGHTRYQCYPGEIWNGTACMQQTHFLGNCFAQGRSLTRQQQRVQAAEAARQSACSNGPAQECSDATAAWQSEENLRQNLLARYRQCQMQSAANNSAGLGLSVYDSTPWFDSLRFDFDY